MDQFEDSARQFRSFPKNLLLCQTYPHNADAYIARLAQRESLLFCPAPHANLKFWEYDDQGHEFRDWAVQNLDDLDLHLSGRRDPKSRFMFISARHSRAPLNVTRDMLLYLLTHHQVEPTFLDFVFTFGQRHHSQLFPFIGVRYERRLADATRGFQLGPLGRSGRCFSLSYNLRGVEPSPDQEDWPWSIRQTAINHSFDILTGRATWIVIKANNLLEKRIKAESTSNDHSESSSFNTNGQSLSASLATHLIYINWVAEHWSWYLDYLEEEMSRVTGRASKIPVETPKSWVPAPGPIIQSPARTETYASHGSWSGNTLSSEKRLSENDLKIPTSPPMGIAPQPPAPPMPSIAGNPDFRVAALQESQQLEESANEVIQVLEANVKVLETLTEFYCSTLGSKDCPGELKEGCEIALGRFTNQVQNVVNELKGQRLRAKSLSRLLNDRKTLLFGTVEYRNMEASRLLAEKANRSAESMNEITKQMHDIAQTTKKETVSMRIITLVTLFFLPGTFITTLMSTDIIRWQPQGQGPLQQSVSSGALVFFLAITVPLMLITFVAWYLVYWCVNRKGDRKDLEAASVA